MSVTSTSNDVKTTDTTHSQQPKKLSKVPHILVAIGIINSIGAVFVILAAFKAFPSSINAISQLGVAGQGIGFGSLGLGVILLSVGTVYLVKNPNTRFPSPTMKVQKPNKQEIARPALPIKKFLLTT